MADEHREKRPTTRDFDEFVRWLYGLRSAGFYGTIAITLQDGAITDVDPKPKVKPWEPLPMFESTRQKKVAG